MQAGQLLLDVATLGVIIFGALGLFLLRSRFSRPRALLPTSVLIRFSFLLFVFGALALIEGTLLSEFGFGWFAAAAAITLAAFACVGPKILKQQGNEN